MHENIRVGDQVFLKDGGNMMGAIREVRVKERELVINIENAGDFIVKADGIRSVHSGKVILALEKLEEALRVAIGHSHDSETQ